MALTTNKKNRIIAEWKAGSYKNYSQVAKANKIDYNTAKKILDGISQSNALLVDVQVALELEKKSIKNPQEVSQINKRAEERLNFIEEDNKISKKNRELLKEFQQKIKNGLDAGNYDNPIDLSIGVKAISEIDKIVRPPAATSNNINLTNAQQNTENKLIIEYK